MPRGESERRSCCNASCFAIESPLSYTLHFFASSFFHPRDRNMYERIVNARRQRLCLLDANQKQRASEYNTTTSSHAPKSDVQKAPTNDSVTADESDKSSMFSLASSSSTSSRQSPSFPSGAAIEKVPSACCQEEPHVPAPEGENEEHFIFELDL